MSEVLRDLVVSLSLDGDNFSRNLTSINKQIQEAESEFRRAASGVDNFEKSVSGTQSQLSSLQQKLELQQKAIKQYERALEAANKKLENAYARQGKLTESLDAAKQKNADLKQQVAAATKQYERFARELGESDSATLAAKANLDALSQEYAESSAEVKKLEGQLAANTKSLQNNADAVTKAHTNLNNAQGALRQTEQQIRTTTERLARMQSAWTKAGDTLTAFGKKCASVSASMEKLGKGMTTALTTPVLALGTAAIKALVGILNGGHIRAHLVGVIGHICDCHIRILCGLFGIAAERLDEACGEARDRFHVLIGRESCRFVCVGGIPLNLLRGVLEQSVNTADQLFIVSIGGDDFFAELYGGGTCGDGHSTECHTYGFENLAEGLVRANGLNDALTAIRPLVPFNQPHAVGADLLFRDVVAVPGGTIGTVVRRILLRLAGTQVLSTFINHRSVPVGQAHHLFTERDEVFVGKRRIDSFAHSCSSSCTSSFFSSVRPCSCASTSFILSGMGRPMWAAFSSSDSPSLER